MKKSIVFILSILFISTFVNAQITVMPYVQGGMSAVNSQIEFNMIDVQYKPKFGYASGLLINYQLNEVLDLRTGIEYQNVGFRSYQVFKDDDPNYSTTWIYGSIGMVDSLQRKVNTTFINIPFQIQYKLRAIKKITPYVAVGANLSWQTRDNSFSKGFRNREFVGESKNTFNYNNILHWGVNLDIGFQRAITEQLIFNAFISTDALMTTLKKDIPMLYQYFNIGGGVGLAYSIQGK